MLVASKTGPTIDKLVLLAGGDIDLVMRAVRMVARDNVADLYDVVKFIETSNANRWEPRWVS